MYPFTFHPILKTRPWGGRRLETFYGKALPPGDSIGESWEISDRAGDESVMANGPLAGKSLRWLMEHRAADVLGDAAPALDGRFPLLCKILDARDRLSLQVHPPASRAIELGGEPKTEMWYIADAEPDAELFVGLRRGVTRLEFEDRIRTGEVADCVHRLKVRRGDTMFLPSGRVHAIGSGLVIFEIQQSSDTTYRVFDWNRPGLDGKPRDLHIPESLASIDFEDVEPPLVESPFNEAGVLGTRRLVRDRLFAADSFRARADGATTLEPARMQILAVTDGELEVVGGGQSLRLAAGRFCLVPASLLDVTVAFTEGSGFLLVTAGPGHS